MARLLETRLFILLVLVAIVSSVVAVDARAMDVEKALAEALSADEHEYLRLRRQLLATSGMRGTLAERLGEPELEEKSRLMVMILMERITHGNAIDAAVQRGILLVHHRTATRRISYARKALAEAFADFPLSLVEYLWKSNELAGLEALPGRNPGYYPLRDRGDEGLAYAASALGLLREKRAVPILLELIRKAEHDVAVGVVGESIREIGSPDSFGDLLDIAENGKTRSAKVAARVALAGCMVPGGEEKLRRAAESSSDSDFRAFALMTAKTMGRVLRQEPTGRIGRDAGPGLGGQASGRKREGGAAHSRLCSGFILGALAGLILGAAVGGFAVVLFLRQRSRRPSR
ncbi:MAG: hypothetical protein ACYTKD_11245 [Planctomycetota bacterium]|jgi:hypothetical protein